MRRISGRRPVRFRLHIDHLANPDRDVWALSFPRRYLTVRRVRVDVATRTHFRGLKARQPKAFITGVGTITLSANKQHARIV